MSTRSPTIVPRVRADALSPREREVLLLLRLGLTDDAIARELGISTVTARHHMAAIRDKLHCNNRVQVLLVAQALGLL
jgi:DNA-binding CsgD family transcriptional regulator